MIWNNLKQALEQSPIIIKSINFSSSFAEEITDTIEGRKKWFLT